MLTNELIDQLEQVTQTYLALREYNDAALTLAVAASKIGETTPTDDLQDKLVLTGEKKKQMESLQQQGFSMLKGKRIVIPSGVGAPPIGQMKIEGGRITFENPLDYVTFFRLVKADQDAHR
jgi:hypothetical protein